ncbi:magnesium-translocating P-type ATPase [Metamycoplasma hyosynoviae]|uniref:magnesium-translocating P-type ATPase n=1 Tax=Metamycoplasma hyosynoviae TaxID=29559 RepID=UPI0023585C96|nr:magnesium-translocating P-type ATPase [Metamycoplasma hyosynoviae]MDC8937850.1 magnesium-translocating P-type ATPase [Metamycoplasma hyosynoviae]MDD7897945.1 magnesium-translocating P-type ATPase [Metamycoplasma hyosynoviae]
MSKLQVVNKSKTEEKLRLSKNHLIECSDMSQDDLFAKFNTNLRGIETDDRIEENREEYGENKITRKGADTVLKRIVRSFFNLFNIILFILAMISMIAEIIVPIVRKTGDQSYTTMIIILVMIFVSSIIHFIQEQRSATNASKLTQMIQTTSLVKRAGILEEIPLKEIVVGDIIHLAAGDIIPADVRILSARDLFVSQSALTGESEPIEKYSIKDTKKNYDNVTDLSNIAFMGTNIISGSAVAIVLAVGNSTYLGQIASKLNEKPVKTNFEKGIKKISLLLMIIISIIVPIVFLIVGFLNKEPNANPWVKALLFGITISVGLTPEMLPMIIISCLSKGAIAMGKKKTIVKNLNSIQNFGTMDILCTDKTGTITQDEVILERHLDVTGKEDSYVLKYAFLNSYYQTGLKNLLDNSIINRTLELAEEDKELDNLELHFEKIDEIPFDFNRKRMSVLVRSLKNNKIKMITKGAVEEIINICSTIYKNGKVIPLDKKTINDVLEKVEEFNNEGMRVIAIASKNNASAVGKFSVADEKEMTLIGYLTFLDPPKDSAESAIRELNAKGVEIKILTGDSPLVTKAICAKVGIDYEKILLGKEVSSMSDEKLAKEVENTQIFAKLTPDQKARIITILRKNGHVVGYMGDGINDAPAMKVADVSISVDTATDIAKETANIILLEKDLNVLATAIVEGRKTHANINKYIKMTVSSNFGNIISILIASILLPFLPMAPIQIILLNLIYDLCCGAIPWDNVDKQFIKKPKQWEYKSILRFMLWFGLVSTIIDIMSFLIFYFVFIPAQMNGMQYKDILKVSPDQAKQFMHMFWTAWLITSMWTQTLVMHFLRTDKVPFIKSNASTSIFITTLIGIGVITALQYIPKVNSLLLMHPLPPIFYMWLAILLGSYIILVSIVKLIYRKIYKQFL